MNRFFSFVLIAVLLLLPAAAHACPVCFGAPGSQDTQALSGAIGLLLGVLAVVLGGIVGFILYLRRNSAEEVPQPTWKEEASVTR